jgi:glutamine amidotransferase
MKKITIIDYEVGNIFSICSALDFLGYNYRISNDEMVIASADALILPGVGAFGQGINQLRNRRLDYTIRDFVTNKQRPLIGICLGMQLLATSSEEHGLHDGLNLIPGKVKRIGSHDDLYGTHVGWSTLKTTKSDTFISASKNQNFYFDHSYHFVPESDDHVIAKSEYGMDIIAAVQKDNICGVQFHPEKSQKTGLKMLRSFFKGHNF